MIISPNKRFVFIHLHKCAGTSVEHALSELLGVNDLVIGSTIEGEKQKDFFRETLGLRKHGTAQDACKFLGAERYAQFYSFAFVRHPVDRLRSLYNYSRTLAANRPLTAEERTQYEADGSFPKRAPYKFKAVQAAMRAQNFNEFVLDKATWKDQGTLPQWASLSDEHGKGMVNFIGKVETMAADWAVVSKRLKVKVPLEVHNPSHFGSADALSDEAWALLDQKYAPDYKHLGYAPRPAAAAPAPAAAPL